MFSNLVPSASSLAPNRRIYRLSNDAIQTLIPLLIPRGYSEAVIRRALDRFRVIDALQPQSAMDWRRIFLFFARRNRVDGITLGHHVFLSSPTRLANVPLIAHEAVHVVQVEKRWLIPFLLRYGGEWCLLRLQGYPDHEAYLALRDEVEARAIEALIARSPRRGLAWLVESDES